MSAVDTGGDPNEPAAEWTDTFAELAREDGLDAAETRVLGAS